MIHADGKNKKRKKTRILTIFWTGESCDLWVDFVILLEGHHGSYNCLNVFKTTGKGFLGLLKLLQTFEQSFMNSKTHFDET